MGFAPCQIIARVEGELASQKTAAAKEDFDEFRAALERREKEMADRPPPQQGISDEQRAEARELVGQAQAKLRGEQDERERWDRSAVSMPKCSSSKQRRQ
jgi:hypothetical protein